MPAKHAKHASKEEGLQTDPAEVAKYALSEGSGLSCFRLYKENPRSTPCSLPEPIVKPEAVAPFEDKSVGCCPCLRCIFMLQCSQCVVGGIYIYI